MRMMQQQAMTREYEGPDCRDGDEIEGLLVRSSLNKTFDDSVPGPAEGPWSLENTKPTHPVPRLREVRQPSGAHSSDYGPSRENLNSRAGTRQKSRFKISSNARH